MGKYIIANWKMNQNFSAIDGYVAGLKKNAKHIGDVIVCVPSVMIKTFSERSAGKIKVGAQNCHFAESGAYTGEVSAQMVKEAGAEYVIIGHSERRLYFDETNDFLNKKLISAIKHGLKVIFCIGETLEQKKTFKSVLKKQILEGFAGVEDFSNVIVAYEPVWAIGTGKVATTEDIKVVHEYIKETIVKNFGVKLPVVYGGSVKPSNCAEILNLDDVDGVLVGGACLNIEDFCAIINSR